MKPNFAERLLPNPGKNVPFLDAIRGIAVLFILIRHAWGLSGEPAYSVGPVSLTPILMMMSSGVDLFFVLSGALLSARFLRADSEGHSAPRYRDYMAARILRIGPPYWLALFLVLLLYTPSMIPNDRIWSDHGAFMAIAHIFFAQSLFMVSFGAYMVASPFWTLTIEMVFYAILPLGVRAFYKGRWWQPVVIAFAISMTWLYLCRFHFTALIDFIRSHAFGLAYSEPGVRFFLSRQIIGYLPHFAIGCSISAILQRRDLRRWTSTGAGKAYFAIGVLIMVISMIALGSLSAKHGFANPEKLLASDYPTGYFYYFFESASFAVAYGLMILGASLASEDFKSKLSSLPGLTIFGVLGYSIYLIHMPLLYSMNQHSFFAFFANGHWHFPVLLLVGGMVIVALSFGMFKAIERPSMVWSSNAKAILSMVKSKLRRPSRRGTVTDDEFVHR